MSPSAQAPSSASMMAWVRTSASEWPSRPSSCVELDPAEHEPPAGDEAMAVVADPGAHLGTVAVGDLSVHVRTSANRSSATRRSSGVVIFRLPGSEPRMRTRRRRARSARRRRWRGPAPRRRPRPARSSSAARRNTCGVCTAHSVDRSSVRATVAPSSADLLDGVGHRRRGDHRGRLRVALELVQRLLEQPRRGQRPGGVVDDHRVTAGAGGQRVAHRVRTAGARRRRRWCPPGRRRARRRAGRPRSG